MRKRLINIFYKYKKYLPEIFLFFVVFILFRINANYLSYPDEFVNLLGGKSIAGGGIPYKDFFDHHLPFAWYLAAVLLKISFNSYVIFRFWWAMLVFGALLFLALWIKKHYRDFYHHYLIFFVSYPLLAVYFWFHLYLADSLAVLFFSIVFWLLLLQTLTKKINFRLILFSSLLTFCLVFSSMTYSYLALALYIWQFYLIGFNWQKQIIFITLTVVPYVVYLIYLLLTKTVNDFYFANVVYNTKLYINIPNYSMGRFFNPLKFGLTLIYNFYQNYLPLLTKIKHLDLFLPIGVLGGLGSLVLLILLLSRWPIIGGLYFFILSFSAPRSNVSLYKETDYQGSLFIVLGFISALMAIFLLKKLKTTDLLVNDLRRIIQVLLTVFLFFSFIFLMKNIYDKFYLVYTQKMPHIYDRADTAEFIDQILEPGDFFWVGPYEPQEEFFVKKARLPGKYPTLLPQFREDEYLRGSFIKQFEINKPLMIIFRHDASIFMTPSLEFGAFFTDWMKDKYTSIEKIGGIKVLKSPSTFNLATDLYLLNSKKRGLIEKLEKNGFIKKID